MIRSHVETINMRAGQHNRRVAGLMCLFVVKLQTTTSNNVTSEGDKDWQYIRPLDRTRKCFRSISACVTGEP